MARWLIIMTLAFAPAAHAALMCSYSHVAMSGADAGGCCEAVCCATKVCPCSADSDERDPLPVSPMTVEQPPARPLATTLGLNRIFSADPIDGPGFDRPTSERGSIGDGHSAQSLLCTWLT